MGIISFDVQYYCEHCRLVDHHFNLFLQETRHLMRLYGKNQPSNSKMRAFEEFKAGHSYRDIAAALAVQEATVEIYTIDAFAAGAPLNHMRMANLLEIQSEDFERIKSAITANSNAKLATIRANLNESFSYNQIRFVLACMIRELDL